MALVRLPEHDDMLERLRRVSDNAYLQERLYPALQCEAGQEKAPVGLVMMLLLAFDACRSGLPDNGAETLDPLGHAFIEALADDRRFVEAAKRHWDTALTQ